MRCTCTPDLLELARTQARHNIDAMLSPEFDAIVSNAAGCGSAMKEYAALAGARSGVCQNGAQQFAAKVRDVTEYLAEVGLREPTRKLDAARHLFRSLPPGARPGRPQSSRASC